MSSPISIGNLIFDSKSELKVYVQNMIKQIGPCSSLKSYHIDQYDFLVHLFERHSEYPEKIDGMIDIAFVPNIRNSKDIVMHIIKENGDHDDISWNNCVSQKKKSELPRALRFAIENQCISFKQNYLKQHGIEQCAICQSTERDKKYHVDHINHFEQIVCEFIKSTLLKRPTIFRDAPGDYMKTFIEDDKPFEDEWKLFHQKHANLRILCASCNLKRPKWRQIKNECITHNI